MNFSDDEAAWLICQDFFKDKSYVSTWPCCLRLAKSKNLSRAKRKELVSHVLQICPVLNIEECLVIWKALDDELSCIAATKLFTGVTEKIVETTKSNSPTEKFSNFLLQQSGWPQASQSSNISFNPPKIEMKKELRESDLCDTSNLSTLVDQTLERNVVNELSFAMNGVYYGYEFYFNVLNNKHEFSRFSSMKTSINIQKRIGIHSLLQQQCQEEPEKLDIYLLNLAKLYYSNSCMISLSHLLHISEVYFFLILESSY